jgi:hypothetical protein
MTNSNSSVVLLVALTAAVTARAEVPLESQSELEGSSSCVSQEEKGAVEAPPVPTDKIERPHSLGRMHQFRDRPDA